MKHANLVLVTLSALALGFCALTWLDVRERWGRVLGAESDRLPPYLTLLERRVRELEERQGELQELLNTRAVVPPPGGSASAAEPSDAAELDARIAALSARIDELLVAAPEPPDPESEDAVGEEEASAWLRTALESFRSQVLNVTRTPEERVSALEVLRRHRSIDAGVASSMLALLEQSDHEPLRVRIARNLHGVAEPACRDAFVRILQHEGSEKLRAEAAECLGVFAGEEPVAALLASVAAEDSSDEVREQAARSLESGGSDG